MLEPLKCRSCGREIRSLPTVPELREGKSVLCRDCSREPATASWGIKRVIRRMGRKPEEFETL